MSRHGRNWPGFLAISAVAAFACGSSAQPRAPEPHYAVLVNPSTIEPRDSVERAILGTLQKLPADTESIVEGHKVTTSAPYDAASGHTCRAIVIQLDGSRRHRLACRMGDAWAYVPNAVRQPGGER